MAKTIKEESQPAFHLVVRQNFLNYKRGDVIEDAKEMAEALEHFRDHVTKVAK